MDQPTLDAPKSDAFAGMTRTSTSQPSDPQNLPEGDWIPVWSVQTHQETGAYSVGSLAEEIKSADWALVVKIRWSRP